MALRIRPLLIGSLGVGLLLAVLALASNTRDRHPGYTVDLRVAAAAPAALRVGFAALPITPELPDPWTDSDGNARRDPGEPWRDGNGNGRFDGVWLAGFHDNRPATGVHDDLWARAMVIDDGRTRIALVVLDAIGFMHDQVVDVRGRIPASAGIDYTVVASTHTHEGPDLMGLWGPGFGRSGVDPRYLDEVIEQAARAAAKAAAALRPAELRFARVPLGSAAPVEDSRPPIVLDPDLRAMQAVDLETGDSLGIFVSWANHPETTWSDNLLLSSDFPHFLREALEHGVSDEGRLLQRGQGGVAVYANGAIGGLMTTSPDFAVTDPLSGASLREPSFEKARAQGIQLAQQLLDALAEPARPQASGPSEGEGRGPVAVREGSLALRARTLELPIDNRPLLLAAAIGVLPRGFTRWATLRSEIAAWSIGPASFLTVPGEIYPEIVNGGITALAGADHPGEPLEVPPLRSVMPGRFRFVVGLANDAVGYIIPRSEWDAEAPWLADAAQESYGEIVSLGPETAPLLHRALLELLLELGTEARTARAPGAPPRAAAGR
jgi:hypothetical protein